MCPWSAYGPLCQAGVGWAFACSCRGASHRRSERPCQDASAILAGASFDTPFILAAVADGHGDRRHDLSHIGAHLAVQTAIHVLAMPAHLHLKGGDESEPDAASTVERRITEMVTECWKRAVEKDAKERSGDLSLENGGDNGEIFIRYGTTLLATSISGRTIFTARIGDGDIAMLRPDGRIEYPVPPDDALVGTVTNSIASRSALTMWRSATIPREEGGYMILATDGLSDSFGGSESHEFEIFLRSLQERVEEYGIERVARSIPAWMERYSELGSGDDITIAMIAIEPEGAFVAKEQQG